MKQPKYGIKAYGNSFRFTSKSKFRAYLMELMAGTDGAERDRAVRALVNLESGIPYTDTDTDRD